MTVARTERRSSVDDEDEEDVVAPLSGLVELGARLAGAPLREVNRLTATLLAAPRGAHFRSTLNNDGSPLQVSVSYPTRGDRPAVRLIADPGAAVADVERRWYRAGRAVSAVLTSHAPEL